MKKLGNIEILQSSCNLSTINDGRGGIFTWLPDQPILEFNMVLFFPDKVRGHHYHPEFTEYFLVVEGNGVLTTTSEKGNISMHIDKGTCIKIPPKTPHVVHSTTNMTAVSMLSKPWGECTKPIVKIEI